MFGCRKPGPLLQDIKIDDGHVLRVLKVSQYLRSEKLQNESFPIFSNFRPEFWPEFCSEFSQNFPRTFRASCFVSWETETRKKSPKIPAIFQCKIPRQTRKNIQKILLESRQSNNIAYGRKMRQYWIIWRKFSPMFVLQFPGRMAARKFMKNAPDISGGTKQRPLTRRL